MLVHERVDFAGAQVAYLIARANGAKDIELSDLIPDWGGSRSQSSDSQIMATLMSLRDKQHRKD